MQDESLHQLLQNCKRETLTEFTKRFLIPALKQHGWDVEDLLEALTNYVDARPGWEQAVKHLEEAASEISRTRRL